MAQAECDVAQVEYYMSPGRLARDRFLMNELKENNGVTTTSLAVKPYAVVHVTQSHAITGGTAQHNSFVPSDAAGQTEVVALWLSVDVRLPPPLVITGCPTAVVAVSSATLRSGACIAFFQVKCICQ